MGYHFAIVDNYGGHVGESTIANDSIEEAIINAKELLVERNTSESYTISITDEYGSPVDSQHITREEVDAYATSRISWANRPELGAVIETGHADSRVEKEKYERGLITPLEFAKLKAGIWTKVWADIESMG